jgi:glutaconate CoA-transferase subunit A
MPGKLADAICRVDDGDEVFIGGFGYNQPFAAAHEFIRQDLEDLRVVRASGGILLDQLVGAGCVSEIVASHCWNVIGPTPTHAFRRAVEDGVPNEISVREYGLGDLVLRLFAGARRLPFVPTGPADGLNELTPPCEADDLATVTFKGTNYDVLQPLNPDVGIIHAARVDTDGNVHVRGPLAEMKHGAMAAETLIVQAEKIVSTDLTRETPERTLLPGFMVDDAVEVPGGARPSGVLYNYERDIEFFAHYGANTETVADFEAFLDKWVRDVSTPREYLDLLVDEGFATSRHEEGLA